MRTYAIEESAIIATGWDPATGLLDLTFRSGDVYRSMKPVEGDTVARLMYCERPGRYFQLHLRGQYGFEKISDHRPVVSPASVVPCPRCRPTKDSRSPDPCDFCLSLRMVPASEALAP